MKKYTFNFLLISILYACNSTTIDSKLQGIWHFSNPNNAGKIVVFEKNHKCYSISQDANSRDTILQEIYTLLDNGKKLVVTDLSGEQPTDTVEILELTTHTFRLKTMQGDTILMNKNKE